MKKRLLFLLVLLSLAPQSGQSSVAVDSSSTTCEPLTISQSTSEVPACQGLFETIKPPEPEKKLKTMMWVSLALIPAAILLILGGLFTTMLTLGGALITLGTLAFLTSIVLAAWVLKHGDSKKLKRLARVAKWIGIGILLGGLLASLVGSVYFLVLIFSL